MKKKKKKFWKNTFAGVLLICLFALIGCIAAACGEKEDKETAHAYGEWRITLPADCTSAGVEERVCSICGETESRKISALGHEYQDEVVNPACTEKGYTIHTCTRCDENYRDSETETLEHDYFDTVVEPTCTAKGHTRHMCIHCGDTYRDSIIPAFGH